MLVTQAALVIPTAPGAVQANATNGNSTDSANSTANTTSGNSTTNQTDGNSTGSGNASSSSNSTNQTSNIRDESTGSTDSFGISSVGDNFNSFSENIEFIGFIFYILNSQA